MYQIPALNTMATPEQRLDFLNQQLRIIATAAMQAKARGDQPTLDTLLALYNKARADAATLRGEANDADQPGAFLLALSQFSETATTVGRDAFGVLQAYANWLPVLLLGALVVVGVGFRSKSLGVKFP